MDARLFLKKSIDNTEFGKLIAENNLTEGIVKLLNNFINNKDENKIIEASIFLEELNISGDTMVEMDHNIDDLPTEEIGSYYLYDILCLYVDKLYPN